MGCSASAAATRTRIASRPLRATVREVEDEAEHDRDGRPVEDGDEHERVVLLELDLLAGYAIRDGLALNILNFIYPISFIERWQAGFALTATFLPLPAFIGRRTKQP